MLKNLLAIRTLKLKKIPVTDNLLEEDIQALSDEQLTGKQRSLNSGWKRRNPGRLPEAFAVVREAGRRVLGLRHFDVQLLGGIILHKGRSPK